MASSIFVEQENAVLLAPALKMRQRLQSAPEKLMKTPAKTLHTPLPFGRKALGIVNKKVATPAVNAQERKLHKPQESKVKPVPQVKVEEYPEIEGFHPYDPLEFEKYSRPEDLCRLGDLALPGLACFPPPLVCEEEKMEASTDLSPMKMPRYTGGSELDDFLQTIDELAVELPPESDLD